jgi:hypothetical protein
VPAQAADQVVCTEEGGGLSYRLDFDWTKSTATIAVKAGKKDWLVLYKDAAAVRNAGNDGAFLAEGTPKEYTAGLGGKCGAFVETWSFDVERTNGKRHGTLEKTPRWVTDGAQPNCKAQASAPELVAQSVRVACD